MQGKPSLNNQILQFNRSAAVNEAAVWFRLAALTECSVEHTAINMKPPLTNSPQLNPCVSLKWKSFINILQSSGVKRCSGRKIRWTSLQHSRLHEENTSTGIHLQVSASPGAELTKTFLFEQLLAQFKTLLAQLHFSSLTTLLNLMFNF